jgi:hypothetical protein
MRVRLLGAALMAACVLGAGAQTNKPNVQGSAAVKQGDPAAAADKILSGFEKDFMGAANAMPADKYDFTPDSLHIPGADFATVRTFAQEVTHVTQANYSIYAGVMGTKPSVDVKAIANLKTKDQIIAALTDSFAVAHKAIATLTVENQNQEVGRGMTKDALALYGAVHGYDHYGQMVEYLRMNGIVPPASAPKK